MHANTSSVIFSANDVIGIDLAHSGAEFVSSSNSPQGKTHGFCPHPPHNWHNHITHAKLVIQFIIQLFIQSFPWSRPRHNDLTTSPCCCHELYARLSFSSMKDIVEKRIHDDLNLKVTVLYISQCTTHKYYYTRVLLGGVQNHTFVVPPTFSSQILLPNQ